MKNQITKVLAAIGVLTVVGLIFAATGTYTSVKEWRATPRVDGTLLGFQNAARNRAQEDIVKRLDFSVTCSGGAASVPIVNSDGRTTVWNTVITDVETSSVAPCSDYWDFALKNDAGIDILAGWGADRRNTMAQHLGMTLQPKTVIGGLTVEVTSASGSCVIYGSIYYK
jgi:hypothetical protein